MSATSTVAQEATPNRTPFSVEGKRAIVTGAGSGINLAFAHHLLTRGCSVLLADLSLRPEAQALLTQYATGPVRAVFAETDVRSWAALDRMFAAADAHFGGIDIVCPGAGIYDPHWSNFWHPPGSAKSKDAVDGDRYASLDVNVTHPIRVTQMAIARFLSPGPSAGKDGAAEEEKEEEKASPSNPKRIIIISSIAGQMSNLHTPIYVAAKHAMNGFIRSLADLDARLGIRVNGVAPGIIRTPLWTEHPEKMAFLEEEKDEWVEPEEVAEAMVRCLEEEGLGGGTVLEVGKGKTRVVQQLGDPGPSGAGHTASGLVRQYEEVYGWLGESGWGTTK